MDGSEFPDRLAATTASTNFWLRCFIPRLPAASGQQSGTDLAEQQAEGPEPETGHATELLLPGFPWSRALRLVSGLVPLLQASGTCRARSPLRWTASISWSSTNITSMNFTRALFVKPLLKGSTEILWHGVDQDVIDARSTTAPTARAKSRIRSATCNRAIYAPMPAGSRWEPRR